jgi:hypothetical protein
VSKCSSLILIVDKPLFTKESLQTYKVLEGQSFNISLNASGNPPQIEYKWSLPVANSLEIRAEGPRLRLSKARRSFRGNYTVRAWNGYGNFNTTVTIFVDIQYAPR